MYLLETLIALTVGGFISFALLDVVCGAMRTMETSANETTAGEILDELSEQTRSFGYRRLVNYVGFSTNLVVNNTATSVYSEPDFHKRQLNLDIVNKSWRERTKSNVFGDTNQGAVLYSVASGPTSDSIQVRIDVSWIDSKSSIRRSLSRTTILFKTE